MRRTWCVRGLVITKVPSPGVEGHSRLLRRNQRRGASKARIIAGYCDGRSGQILNGQAFQKNVGSEYGRSGKFNKVVATN